MASVSEIELSYSYAKASELEKLLAIEQASYPADEAASMESLSYRCKNANAFFLVARVRKSGQGRHYDDLESKSSEKNCRGNKNDKNNGNAADDNDDLTSIVGFICATLTVGQKLNHESMSTHDNTGTHLCIHSVVIDEAYRRQGLGSRLLAEYIQRLKIASSLNRDIEHGDGKDNGKDDNGDNNVCGNGRDINLGQVVSKISLIAKKHLIGFYSQQVVGFELVGESEVEHGKDQWYELTMSL